MVQRCTNVKLVAAHGGLAGNGNPLEILAEILRQLPVQARPHETGRTCGSAPAPRHPQRG